MHFFFFDDSKQNKPGRTKMGSLVAIGGVAIKKENVNKLEKEINNICTAAGFPRDEKFKWSPGKELWMRDNLTGEYRENFYFAVLEKIKEHNGTAFVVIEDTKCSCATGAKSHEEDAVRLFLERVEIYLQRTNSDGIVISDRPGGDRKDEDKFLSNCLETIESGTTYIKPECIALNVLSANSKYIRLLQAADLITACTLAYVSGEVTFSPKIFEKIKPLFDSDKDRIGGVGLKIHPDFKYANLYHWLLGDTHFVRFNTGFPLPFAGRPYNKSPN
jgi:hypothetical protein